MKTSPQKKQTLGFRTFTYFNFTFCLYISHQEKTAEILIKKNSHGKRALHFISCSRWSTNGIFYTARRVLSSSLVFSRNRSKTPPRTTAPRRTCNGRCCHRGYPQRRRRRRSPPSAPPSLSSVSSFAITVVYLVTATACTTLFLKIQKKKKNGDGDYVCVCLLGWSSPGGCVWFL